MWLLLFVTTLLSSFVISVPVPDTTTDSFVAVSTDIFENGPIKEPNIKLRPPELKRMNIISNVTNRYAHTVVSSRFKNPEDQAQEATFSIVLPDTAFITGFLMEIKGKTYEGYVREKEEAKREYQQAVQAGLGAAHVEVNARDSNRFTVSMNVEAHSKVTFNLTYEELLVRKHGKYEMVINLNPGQLVKDLTVDVYINETKPLVKVKTPSIRSGNEILEEIQNSTNEYVTITKLGNEAVHIHFAPDVQQQKDMAKKLELAKKDKTDGSDENKGLGGQFVVEYDVERGTEGGEVLVNDGYFVHFFAPADLKPLPKHAVFVLDVSGSMGGRKIEQLRQAMLVILDQLNPDDYFNLVEFSSSAKVWNLNNKSASPIFESSRKYWWRPAEEEEKIAQLPKELPPAFPVTTENIREAKNIVQEMSAGGGTNIYDALKVGLNLTLHGVPTTENTTRQPQPVIIFLTDGDATDGETNPKVILNMVSEFNDGGDNAAIFSLAFGYDANKDILKKLSLKNSGFMRPIYEAADASLQLQNFYKEISSPLLANVTFKYPESDTNSITRNHFHTLFDGAELVVAGKMENPKDKILYVHGLTYDGPIDFPPIIIPIPVKPDIKQEIGSLERLWAYMTIKQLLDKKDQLDENNSTDADNLKKQALKLALKYSFVTPVTSLVVVKPNETEKVNTEEASAGSVYPLSFNSAPLYASFVRPVGGSGFAALSTPAKPFAGFGGYSGYAAPVGMSGPPVPEAALSSFTMSFEETDTESYYTTTVNLTLVPSELEIPWLASLLTGPNTIQIDGVTYDIGTNDTQVHQLPCQVQSSGLAGNCTLLASCPQVYENLTSFETYKNEYFCTLESNAYIGVCCPDSLEE